jgi:hypothetical protein
MTTIDKRILIFEQSRIFPENIFWSEKLAYIFAAWKKDGQLKRRVMRGR